MASMSPGNRCRYIRSLGGFCFGDFGETEIISEGEKVVMRGIDGVESLVSMIPILGWIKDNLKVCLVNWGNVSSGGDIS